MKNLILVLSFFSIISCTSDKLETPLEKNEFKSLTTYTELTQYVNGIAQSTPNLTLKIMTVTSTGKSIPYLLVSDSNFGQDTSKIKVLIFAQQHGNEQSGKEGALLLLKEFADGGFYRELRNIDLIIVPQVNPDGSDENKRTNAEGKDLNRDHLLLSTNEIEGLHRIFNQFQPSVTLDVHEYYPYSDSWEEFGLIKFFDEQFGTVTNINVDSSIQQFQKEKFLPFIEEYLAKQDFTMNEYVLGGPPNEKRMRFSTVDINDGRQSMGIQNSFSMILEGKRGKDSLDYIKHRAEGQYYSMKGFLKFISQNKSDIKKLVHRARKKLLSYNSEEVVAVRMEHFGTDASYPLRLRKSGTEIDTVVQVDNFHSVVKPLLEVKKPYGYLIPKSDEKLLSFIIRHGIEHTEQIPGNLFIERYYVDRINSSIDEGLDNKYPQVETHNYKVSDNSEFYFIPITQLKGNMIMLVFEPQSMLGLVQYNEFEYLLRENSFYPIMRVLKTE